MRMDDLRKEYPGGTVAVQQVSVGLQDGEVFGLLGPNGKTTPVDFLFFSFIHSFLYSSVKFYPPHFVLCCVFVC